jgi:hypothetical protein
MQLPLSIPTLFNALVHSERSSQQGCISKQKYYINVLLISKNNYLEQNIHSPY